MFEKNTYPLFVLKKAIVQFLILVLVIGALSSCTSDKEEGLVISDAALYELVRSQTFTYFKRSGDTLPADPASEHLSFIRVSFNPRAVSVLNDSASNTLTVPFPDESLIVKEIYNFPGGPLTGYAIMYKEDHAANSGSGWIWNEMNPDGSVTYSASRKGDQCIGCHSSGQQADLVRTFSLH